MRLIVLKNNHKMTCMDSFPRDRVFFWWSIRCPVRVGVEKPRKGGTAASCTHQGGGGGGNPTTGAPETAA